MYKRNTRNAKTPTWPEETEAMIARAEQEIREKDCNDFGMFETESEQCSDRPVHNMRKYMANLRREE